MKGHDIDAAMNRIEARMLASFDVIRIPERHLRAMAEAVLEPVLTPHQVDRLIHDAVQAAVAQMRESHEHELSVLKVEHNNELVDVQDRIKAARERGVQQGKRAMRVKHAKLAEATESLREARRLVNRVVSWSGDAKWKARVLEFLDRTIDTYDPEGRVPDVNTLDD